MINMLWSVQQGFQAVGGHRSPSLTTDHLFPTVASTYVLAVSKYLIYLLDTIEGVKN